MSSVQSLVVQSQNYCPQSLGSMQSSSPLYLSATTATLGQRRGISSNCSRVPLDLGYSQSGAVEGSRAVPYPSPPMSGSPPFALKRIPNSVGQGESGFGASTRNVSPEPPGYQGGVRASSAGFPSSSAQDRGLPPVSMPYGQRQEHAGPGIVPAFPRFPEAQSNLAAYPTPPRHHQGPYPPSPQPLQPQQQIPPMSMYPSQVDSRSQYPPPGHGPTRTEDAQTSGDLSPRSQRKPKGHVAAACVPCKRAHLRCDNSRPCARCISNGKEDACIDTQHKKRGRPRLRDEREARYEPILGAAYPSQHEPVIGRAMPMYGGVDSNLHQPYDPAYRPGHYRVLKSHEGQPPARYPDHNPDHHSLDNRAYGSAHNFGQGQGHGAYGEVPCAYLTIDLQLVCINRAFEEVVGIRDLAGRLFLDIVATAWDKDKVYKLQRALEEERQQREPNYLPPILERDGQFRAIQAINMRPDDITRFPANRQENLGFLGPAGSFAQRTFDCRLGLQKFQSTYFVILLLVPSYGSQPSIQPLAYDREAQHSYQYQPGYNTAPSLPVPAHAQYNQPPYTDPRVRDSYRPSSAHMSSSSSPSVSSIVHPSPAPPVPSYAQSFQPQSYGPQSYREVPRSQLPPGQAGPPPSRPHELQLPPLRASVMTPHPTPREERRLDIHGLLEDPASNRGR